jgi:hypothetical protein
VETFRYGDTHITENLACIMNSRDAQNFHLQTPPGEGAINGGSELGKLLAIIDSVRRISCNRNSNDITRCLVQHSSKRRWYFWKLFTQRQNISLSDSKNFSDQFCSPVSPTDGKTLEWVFASWHACQLRWVKVILFGDFIFARRQLIR